MANPTPSGALLFDERVVAVQPSLVRIVGSLGDAAVLQQIHYHAQAGHVEDFDGEAWVKRTYADLGGELGLTFERVRRAIARLESNQLVESCQPEGHIRRKWYRIDYDRLTEMSKWQNGRLQLAEPPLPSGETAASSLQSSKERRGELNGASAVPDSRIQSLVSGFIDDYRAERDGHDPPRSWRASAGAAIKRALADGEAPKDVAICLGVIAHESKQPSTLPYVLADFHAKRERRVP